MKKLTWIALLMLVALPLSAGTAAVDLSHKATGDADVMIELISGDVRVIGWDRDEVRVEGTVNEKWETVEISGDADDIHIEVTLPKGSHRNVDLDADLEIHVPYGVELRFEAVSSTLRVTGLTNSVEADTVSGSIDIGPGLRELSVESVSGTVMIEATSSLQDVEAETVSGSIEMEGPLHPSGDYSFGAVSGRITLRVPAGTNAEYDLETFSGRIDNDFGPKAKKDGFLPSQSLSFVVGSGGADVEIEIFSGSIHLKEM